jgi:hypothetical protein
MYSAHYIALDQGDIVGREYIISSECLPPYGILLADLTIEMDLYFQQLSYLKLLVGARNHFTLSSFCNVQHIQYIYRSEVAERKN